jgi:hypothetical protein
MKFTVLLLLCAVTAPALTSCSEKLCRIKPYERGVMAKHIMSDAPDPLLAAMTEHAYFSREAAFGGGGVGGGGCGCN